MRRAPTSVGPRLVSGLETLGVVLLVALAALVVDAPVAEWVAGWKHPVADTIVGVLNPIGSGVTLMMACAALAVLARGFHRSRLQRAAWCGTLAFAAAGLLEFAIKHLVGRPRPDADLPALALMGPSLAPDVDSFPSGHATSVFAVATVFASHYPSLRWPLYALAAAVAAGRVYLDRHYVSDIVAGAAIGSLVAAYLVRRIPEPVMPRPAPPAAEA